MEKIEIQKRFAEIENLYGFVSLLNDIKIDEFGTRKHPITTKQLLSLCDSESSTKRYKVFHIRKKNGKLREINAPCYELGIILHILNIAFRAVYTPGKSAMGFTEGRSIVSNAAMHVGHHYVFNIDLENFFPSIPQARVWKRIQLPPFNLPQPVANVVAGLCCNKNEDGTKNVLPQGAATSPLLTNAICDTLDRRMRGVAKRFGLHYSRYADDMTFSSMYNVYQDGSDFRKEIKHVIEEQGFTMNDSKTRLLREGERQEVTGLTVNDRVNVAKKYIKNLRVLLHIWEQEGYEKAYSVFYKHYKAEKGYIKKGEPVMENVIGGKLDFLRMVKGINNSTYNKLKMRYDALQQMVFEDTQTDKSKKYVYVQSYAMKNFNELFETNIIIDVNDNNKLVAKCDICGIEKCISIAKSTKDIFHTGRSQRAYHANQRILQKCSVTLCRAKGKNFWLITKNQLSRSKCLSLQQTCRLDVDKLLDIWDSDGLETAVQAFTEAIKNGNGIINPNEKIEIIDTSSKKKPRIRRQMQKLDSNSYANVELAFSEAENTNLVDAELASLYIEWDSDDLCNLPGSLDDFDPEIDTATNCPI